jgi:HNH endonuclease
MRYRNTNSRGGRWTTAEIDAVWRKGKVVPGYDSAVLRKDACNAWIRRSEYGQETENGWEIDHLRPVSQGGGDQLANLQPLQWQNNRHKSDSWPQWSCAVAAG